ncbi:MAG: hypothetical protein ABR511_09755 [Acidimicrobiales bacterium]
MLALVVVATALAGLAACSGKAASEPRRPLDTTAAPGTMVVSDAAIGFAVSIPTSWKTLPTDVSKFDDAAAPILAASTKVAVGLTQLKSVVREGANMAAIDPDTGATVNLNSLDAGGQSVSKIAVGAAKQLSTNGATGVTRDAVTVDGVKAVRQRFHTPFPGETGPVDLSETQVYAVRRGQLFILTLAGDSPALDGIAASLKLA